MSQTGFTYITYTAKNNTSKILNGLSIDPNYGTKANTLKITLNNNTCTTLAVGATCSFIVSLQGINQSTEFTLMPRICAYNGAVCSVPVLNNRIRVTATKTLPSSQFPFLTQALITQFIIRVGQWLPPNQDPIPPFNRVSAIFVAFAHTYAQQNGAIFTYEQGQPDEPARLALLVQSARAGNPNIKILISLGWGKMIGPTLIMTL